MPILEPIAPLLAHGAKMISRYHLNAKGRRDIDNASAQLRTLRFVLATFRAIKGL